MEFWKLAFEQKWVDAEQLKGAVKCEKIPFGEITPEEYKLITGLDFVEVPKEPPTMAPENSEVN